MVKKKELQDPDELKVTCLKCPDLMYYSTFGRNKDEVYRCSSCGKMVYKDYLDISIAQGYISVKNPDGSEYQP